MSEIALAVENLSKRYFVGHDLAQPERQAHLREVISRNARSFVRKTKDMLNGRPLIQGDTVEEFWALKDVSFEVKQGERLGIIGRNGAGKSTLLKILSRITEPTEGRIQIASRVASLLEVGTGFHPELSGRDNIYLNGALLGMSRAEVRRKFDSIVDFAEVEKFLDTPVKHYSSGMYVRLAFAISAHMETEILIADEVLAVGDARFQRKCLDKMGEASQHGRTVLFVSHNMAAISQLCGRTLLLDNGRLVMDGPTDDATKAYFGEVGSGIAAFVNLVDPSENKVPTPAFFSRVSLHNESGEMQRNFSIGDDLVVRFNLHVSEEFKGRSIKLALQLRTADGIAMCNMTDTDSSFQLNVTKEKTTIDVQLQDMRFYPGEYFLSLWSGSLDSRTTFDFSHDCISFEIVDGGTRTTRHLPRSAGLLYLTPLWKLGSRSSI